MLRLLLIGDSHCKADILPYLKKLVPDIQIFCITCGSQAEGIIERYSERFPAIVKFDPSAIIIHFGHNDFSYHHYHNQSPATSKEVTDLTLELTKDVVRNIPSTPHGHFCCPAQNLHCFIFAS